MGNKSKRGYWMTNVSLSNRCWNFLIFFPVTKECQRMIYPKMLLSCMWPLRYSHALTVLMAISSSARKNPRLCVNYRLAILGTGGYSSQYNPVCNLHYVLGTKRARRKVRKKWRSGNRTWRICHKSWRCFVILTF